MNYWRELPVKQGLDETHLAQRGRFVNGVVEDDAGVLWPRALRRATLKFEGSGSAKPSSARPARNET